MPHRDFDAARAERVRQTEPVSFTLGGETFSCVVEPTLGDILALAGAPEPEESEVEAVRAILAFTGEIVVPEDRARFRRLVRRERPRRFRRRRGGAFSAADVVALAFWLVEVYTGRPTRPSSGSSDGRRGSGVPSNGISSDGAEGTSASSASGSD